MLPSSAMRDSYNLEKIALIFRVEEKISYDNLLSNDLYIVTDDQLARIEEILKSQNPMKRALKSMDKMNDSQYVIQWKWSKGFKRIFVMFTVSSIHCIRTTRLLMSPQ